MPKGKHTNHATASRQHRWKAGSRPGSTGHVKARVGKTHPLADPNGWVYEHLIVWVAAGNPRPEKGKILHHINGDKTDNRIENLEILTRAEHNALHLREGNRRCPYTGRLKKKAGRLLDGTEHNAMPQVQP